MRFGCLLLVCAAVVVADTADAAVRIPALTAYVEPDANGARFSSRGEAVTWTNPEMKLVWFGNLRTAGKLECSVSLRLPAEAQLRLRLSVAGESREAVTMGKGSEFVEVGFGAFEIGVAGYQRFALEQLAVREASRVEVQALILDGLAIKDAHFNLKPRRNAASVHLMYPAPKDEKIEAFYCEMTGLDDPLWTYYMACGWHRGYFGMQVNSESERRIIFSVWDSGSEAVDRAKVAADNRVALVAKGEGVVAGDFGNEGTGGHSHWVYNWKTGQKQRFLVTARPIDPTHTVYSGFFFHPEKKQWMLISSWKAPKEGQYLRGLYSFSENFGGSNGHLRRKALYGNQWIRTADGRWIELTVASFSHDSTGRSDRLDRFMGIEDGQFFLSHGGFVAGFTEYGRKFTRPATGRAPNDIVLPPLP